MKKRLARSLARPRLALFALLMLAGCASQQPPSDRFGLATQPVYVVHSQERRFKVSHEIPRGRLVFDAESAEVERSFGLKDPITYGKERVVIALRRNLPLADVQ